MSIHSKPIKFIPRPWQKECLKVILATCTQADSGKNFLAVATPGSGKTMMAIHAVRKLIELGFIDRVIIIAPTTELIDQWSRKCDEMGIVVNACNTERLKNLSLLNQQDGIILSYQSLAVQRTTKCDGKAVTSYDADLVNNYAASAKIGTIAIIDEIHHAGLGNAWGNALTRGLAGSRMRLCLSGTPFRQKGNIPYVYYDEQGMSVANYNYTYKQALVEKCCRIIQFEVRDAKISWIDKSGVRHEHRLSEEIKDSLRSSQHEAAIDPDGQFMQDMFIDAHNTLLNIRSRGGIHAKAGGLIICRDIQHAEKFARMIEVKTGEKPFVIHNKVENPGKLINEFRQGDQRWMVAIQMISEGVDIPRLRVGLYASNRKEATLFMRQFFGRFVRLQDPTQANEERAIIFVPHIPSIYKEVRQIEEEVRDVFDDSIVFKKEITTGAGRPPKEIKLIDSETISSEVVVSGFIFPEESIGSVINQIKKNTPPTQLSQLTPQCLREKAIFILQVGFSPQGAA